MKRFAYFFALLGLSACGGTTITDPSSSASALLSASTTNSTVSSTPSAPEADADFASLLNAVRADNGAEPVTHNELLDQAAQNYATVLLVNDHFSHTGPDGSTLRERVDATGYDWVAIGENLGMGQQNEESIMAGWTGSPGHHENNINPIFEEFGLGFSREGYDTRWVLVLGTPR